MTCSNEKKIGQKIMQFLFILPFCYYLGYAIGKDMTLQSRRNADKNTINKTERVTDLRAVDKK
jgi:hypothetical protein